ncbi:MAG: PadR family transcriptional regulator [Haloarculaceae archaeon]
MSGEDLHITQPTTPAKNSHESGPGIPPELLQRVGSAQGDTTPAEILSTVVEELLDSDIHDVTASGEVVTQSLDEILLALIALRDDGTHGTALMEDLSSLFGVEPSPGTVYPCLHDLESDGALARHNLVQTKQYAIRDEDAAAERMERAMYQHLAVGLFLQAALDAV